MKKIKRILLAGVAILLMLLLMGIFPSCDDGKDKNSDTPRDDVVDEPSDDEKPLE